MSESNAIRKVKSAIIGKAWRNADSVGIIPATFVLPSEMTFQANESYLVNGLSFRTDRNTKIPVTVKAGEKLFFYVNKKRPFPEFTNPATGLAYVDPDYSVSVQLEPEQAEAVIADSKSGSENWKKEHAVA